MIGYHGTDAEFGKFDDKFMGSAERGEVLGSGFYFGVDEDIARHYGNRVLKCEIRVLGEANRYDGDGVSEEVIRYLITRAPDYKDSLLNFGDIDNEGLESVLAGAVDTFAGLRHHQIICSLSNDFYKDNPAEFNRNFVDLTGINVIWDQHFFCVLGARYITVREAY
jgi:hypothetical protein